MTTSAITYSLKRNASWLAFDAAMPCDAAHNGVRGYVTLARRYVR
jgi:hypothetical protein